MKALVNQDPTKPDHSKEMNESKGRKEELVFDKTNLDAFLSPTGL